MAIRINIGCGTSPTPGWTNFDNSLTVRLAAYPWLVQSLRLVGLVSKEQIEFARVVRKAPVKWANAVRRIPVPDSSAEVIYTSHMIEHLDRAEARAFLAEARRVLQPGGIVRAVVPDLARLVQRYVANGEADALVAGTLLAQNKPDGLLGLIRCIAVGLRHHAWMYDGQSLARLLEEAGFQRPIVLPSGETTIPHPGELDLREREGESVYVEATKP